MNMKLAIPQFLWLLLLVPALVGFFWLTRRAKQRLMTRFIQARLLSGLLADVSPGRQKLKLVLLAAAVGLLALTLARPQWGFHLEEVKQRGLDIVVGIDTSRSMLANDVNPNRLERSKLEALALLQLCRADRLGLVAFAGTAFLQNPLSLDDDAFRQGLEALNTGIIPQGGTALSEAIRTALTAFKEKSDNHKVLVLFTDGEDHDGKAVEAAREAAKEGMRIFTIGVGTPNGELISVTDDEGHRSFLKDSNGNVVKSSLNEALLREVAAAGNGFYLPMSGARTMDTLYERGLAPLPKSDSDVKTLRQYHERFQWFLGLAIVLLLVEMLLPDAKSSSKGLVRGATASAGLVVLFLLLASTSAPAASTSRAMQEYRKGNYDRAYSEYEKLSSRKPDDPRLRYNAGAAAYQAREYEEALKHFSASLAAPDLKLQEQSYYNLGNTHFRVGEDASDPKKQMAEWQQAVSNFESALKLNTADEDARYNLEVVKKKLEQLKQQQQQNQDKDQDKDQDKNQDKDKDKNKDQQQNKQDQKDQQQQNQQQDKKDDQQQQQSQQGKDDQKNQQNQQQQNQQDQKDQQQQDQQQQQSQQDSKQQQNQAQSQPGQEQQKESGQEQEGAQANQVVRMTPQQARQILDAQRAEEKPMPFWRLLRTNRVERPFKDW